MIKIIKLIVDIIIPICYNNICREDVIHVKIKFLSNDSKLLDKLKELENNKNNKSIRVKSKFYLNKNN